MEIIYFRTDSFRVDIIISIFQMSPEHLHDRPQGKFMSRQKGDRTSE